MAVPVIQIDAFTDAPFAGNPAAVCLLDEPRTEEWMQSVAAEMNLSETAFPAPEADGYRLRWFTPLTEVKLCGHATLATAHALWTEGRADPQREIRFSSWSGPLTARRRGEAIELDFPARPETEIAPPEGLVHALGVEPRYTGRSAEDLIVLVDSEQTVRSLAPDIGLLRRIDCRGLIVTAQAETAGFDFVSRFFAPALGIDEDPVTGSAHCCLGPFWVAHLGKTELRGYQASARGGAVDVRVDGDRVFLAGQAVTVLRGELLC